MASSMGRRQIIVEVGRPRGRDFNAAQGTVSEGAVTVKSVEADTTATWSLTGSRDASGPLTCEVNRVSRTYLPGQ